MAQEDHPMIHDPLYEEIAVGDVYLAWKTLEYPKHDRSTRWYVISSIIGALLLFYSLMTANYLFAIIVIMMAVILVLNIANPPREITVAITSQGIILGDHFYPYDEVKDFSVVYRPPHVKTLYVDFLSILHPIQAVPLENVNPNDVREVLLNFVLENLDREEEGLTDFISRVYKL